MDASNASSTRSSIVHTCTVPVPTNARDVGSAVKIIGGFSGGGGGDGGVSGGTGGAIGGGAVGGGADGGGNNKPHTTKAPAANPMTSVAMPTILTADAHRRRP